MEAEPLIPAKPKCRWFQFSLRTLLIATAVVAIPCAWLGRKFEQKRREREAVETISAKFGLAEYRQLNGPGWLRGMLGDGFFTEVDRVSFRGGSHDDDDLAVLDDLPHVRELDLQDASIHGPGLSHLRGLSELVRLDLKRSLVDDAGLKHLTGLSHLEYLDLSGTKVSDVGLSDLNDLTHLKELDLLGTKVTDRGVEKLKKMLPHLKSLSWESGFWSR